MGDSICVRILTGCLLLAMILPGCSGKQTSIHPTFESTECKFGIPPMTTIEVECGNLMVPEDRANKDSPIIKLHVAILKSDNPDPEPEPVVYLEGGWGYPVLANLSYLLPKFNEVLKNRDVIFYDQRGIGYSEPSLDCPEISNQVYQDTTNILGAEVRIDHYLQAAQTCHDRLLGAGINLNEYNTRTNAADVEDLRNALRYSKFNLYGVSYGTRIALEVMDHYPKGVRSAILDSTYPMQTNVFVEEAGAMERSLELITERCKADAACNRKYPDVKNVFFDLVAKLDQHPRGMMTGNGFIETVWGWLYAADFIPVLPQILYEFNAGNWTDLPSQPSSAASINTPPEATMSEGKRFSVICAEEIPQTSPQEIQAVNQNTSARLMDYFNEPIFKICSIWGVTPEDQSNFEPVSSNIPAIIFQGDYDPATPPAWGKLTAQNLKNSYFLEFTGLSHSVLGAGAGGGKCSKSIMQAFLENPHVKPEINCLEDLKIYFITANL